MKKINVTQSSMPSYEEYTEEIKDLWTSKWLSNMGVKHKTLKKKLQNYMGVNHVSLFTNGHMALESAISSFNLTGEVITTPYTFVSTTHAIVRNGLKPVFCDINPDNYTIDVTKLESLITDKTTAIVPVHVYGNVCNVHEIKRIADKYNLKVIYDAAHVFGVKVDGLGVGNFGDASMFSFHATKVFNTIEGGAVTYNDPNLFNVLNAHKNFGITGEETVDYITGNAKMNEFQAAMGLCNLQYVDREIAKRKKVTERYFENLQNVDGIKLNTISSNITSNYAYFPVVFDGYKYTRDEIKNKLEQNNIYSRKYFYPITTEFNIYKEKYDSTETPIAKYLSERVLTLPLYANLELSDVDKICKIILK